MANEEHLAILRQGVKIWNEWREERPRIIPDLHQANLNRANLTGVNLINANLNFTNLSEAKLCQANLIRARFVESYLYEANFSKADLRFADFGYSNLSSAKLIGAKLNRANLENAILGDADFSNANLREANLNKSQALFTNFTGAILTGACIADWHIGSLTQLEEVSCEYIFRTFDDYRSKFSGRLPVDPERFFEPGEFTQRFQILASALETIDLTFTEGIDWKAFFTSFQKLQSQHPDNDLSIQGMERKGESFIVRLEVNQEADKAAIETQAKQLYANQLQLIEAQYRQQLHAKDREIEIYKQQSTDLLELAKLAASRPIMVEATAMASSNDGPKYNLQGAQFAGGFAELVQGNQVGGVINNYSVSLDEVTLLITALREQIQTFPSKQKDNALNLLNDIETDLKKPQPDTGRLGRKLKQLAAVGAAAATLAGGAATFSGNLNDFTSNVLELTGKLGVPIELVLPSQRTP